MKAKPKVINHQSVIKIEMIFGKIEIRIITERSNRKVKTQGLFLLPETFNRLAAEMIKFIELQKKINPNDTKINLQEL